MIIADSCSAGCSGFSIDRSNESVVLQRETHSQLLAYKEVFIYHDDSSFWKNPGAAKPCEGPYHGHRQASLGRIIHQ